MRVEQGKGIERRRKEKKKDKKEKKKRKNESERGLKKPIVTFLSSPSKDVRLWRRQIATFFFLT